MTRSTPTKQGAQRPYWLLLALALLLAGQFAAINHWHDGDTAPDYDCSLCVLSSAGVHAVTSDAWHLPLVPFAFVVSFSVVIGVRREAIRFCDARAPPVYLQTV